MQLLIRQLRRNRDGGRLDALARAARNISVPRLGPQRVLPAQAAARLAPAALLRVGPAEGHGRDRLEVLDRRVLDASVVADLGRAGHVPARRVAAGLEAAARRHQVLGALQGPGARRGSQFAAQLMARLGQPQAAGLQDTSGRLLGERLNVDRGRRRDVRRLVEELRLIIGTSETPLGLQPTCCRGRGSDRVFFSALSQRPKLAACCAGRDRALHVPFGAMALVVSLDLVGQQ